MDIDPQILLQELVEAVKNLDGLVEAVSSPDWWAIGITSAITIINAAIMVWLGWNQYKLQKRQTEAQEYNVYRKLYILLSNANSEIDNFIEELDRLLWAPWHNSDKNALSRKKTHIDKLLSDLRESYVDYELKLSKETFNKNGYLKILSLMSRVLQHTIDSLEKGEAQLSQGTQTIYNVNGDMEEGDIRHICSHFKGGVMLDALYQTLKQFVELKKSVRCDDSLLESIGAKCKID